MNRSIFTAFALTSCFVFCPVRAADLADEPLKTPPDWKAEVIGRPPQVTWPSVVEAAPDGRIFVAEDPMDMKGPTTVAADRILCIFPDGHQTVFADHLYAVFGLRYYDGKLYVHHCPVFSVFTDDHGIGKDRKDIFEKDTLHSGDNNLNDHIPSNLRLAMDNHFYMTTGDKGFYHAKSTVDGSEVTIHGGGIIRIRPDGTDAEGFCTGTRNHLDVAINSEDEMFTYDNTDDGLGWNTRYTHMVDGGFYGYPFDYEPRRPYTLWLMHDYGGGAPTGAVGYNEDALPEEFRGNLFHCEWGKGHFARVVVERDGGTYKITKYEPLLEGPNLRPLGVSVLPDGSGFLVTDWQMGGWGQPKIDGRLIKLTYKGATHAASKPAWYIPAAQGEKFEASVTDLIAGLSHPAESVRLVAQRRLGERGREAVQPLIALLNDSTAPAYARWHAIWALDLIDAGKAGREAVLAILKDDKADMTVRRQAARQLGTRRAAEATAPLIALLDNSDAPMRFQAATALGRIGNPDAVPALLKHLTEKDFFTRYAIFTALNRIGRAEPRAWPAIIKGLASDQAEIREGTQFAVRETFEKSLVDALSAMVADKGTARGARAAALQAIAPLHRQQKPWDGSWWGTQPRHNPPPPKVIEWEGTPVVLAAIRDGLSSDDVTVRDAAIAAMQIAPDPQAAEILTRLFRKETDPHLRKQIIAGLGTSKSESAANLIVSILDDPAANADVMVEAIDAARAIRTDQTTAALVRLAGSSTATATQLTDAFNALAKLTATSAVPVLAKQLNNPNAQVAVAAVAALGEIHAPEALAALESDLSDARPQVRLAVVAALGNARDRHAIEPLVSAYQNEQTKDAAILALAQIPDIRALDAYLDGLGGQDAGLRNQCRKAITELGASSLPKVEERLGHFPITPTAIQSLQQIYGGAEPIRNWLVLGPFANPTTEPFEVSRKPVLTQTFKAEDGKLVRWEAFDHPSSEGFVDLAALFSPNAHVTAYAATEIDSKTDRDVTFETGSDDGMAIWLNGQRIFEDLDDRGWRRDQFHPHGHLKEGKNLLVVKVLQNGGPWGFSVAMPGERHGKLWDYKPADNSPEVYAAFALAHEGRPESGKAIFQNVNGVGCIKCHSVAGQGGQVGPALESIGTKYTRAQILESVLYPSKQIAAGYEQSLVRTKDGNTYAGVVRQETPDEITLFDSTAKKTVIRKSDIQVRKTTPVSVMPEGLQQGLTPQQFADLISYLQSLKDAAPR